MSLLFSQHRNTQHSLNLEDLYLLSAEHLSQSDRDDLVGRFIRRDGRYRVNDKTYTALYTHPFKSGIISNHTRLITVISSDTDPVQVGDDDDDDLDISHSFLHKSILSSPSSTTQLRLDAAVLPTASSHQIILKPSHLAELEVYNGDWAIAQMTHSAPRLVQLHLSDQPLQSGSAYLSSQLLFNLASGRRSHDSKVTLKSINQPIIPTASSVTIARISSPISLNKHYQDRFYKALHNHFIAQPRLYKRGDVIGVDISDELVDKPRFEEDGEEGDYEHPLLRSKKTSKVWFKVSNMSVSPPNDNLGAWVLPEHTEMVTLGVHQSYVPTITHKSPFQSYQEIQNLFESAIKSFGLGLDIQLTALIVGKVSGSALHSVSGALGLHHLRVNCYDIADDNQSQVIGAIQAQMEKAASCLPLVVQFDNVEAVFAKSDDKKGGRLVSAFKECLEYLRDMSCKHRLPSIVIATTEDGDKLENDFMGCFKHEIKIEAPSRAERAKYVQSLLSDMQISNDVSVAEIADHTASLFADDILHLIGQAHILALQRALRLAKSLNCDIGDVMAAGITISNDDIHSALKHTKDSFASNIGAPSIPNVKWDDIGGLKNVKDEILDTVQLPLQKPELFAGGLKKRSGVLLFGPPGTGKTLLAKAVATECALNFFSVKGPELLNMYIGESEANVRRIFQKARDASPCVIFFDELDSVAPKRGNQGDSGGVMDRIVSQLLAELDGMSSTNAQVFVIGATNRPDLLDSALLRPGRFDRMIYLDVPSTHAAQANILTALTRKFELEEGLDLLSDVADHLPLNLTGADLYALCSDAMLKCMTRRVMTIEKEIQDINALSEEEFTTKFGNAHRRPITPQYYLEFMTDMTNVSVVVSKVDFGEAMADLTPSVTQDEMENYRRAQLKFTNVGKEAPVKKDKGKGKARAD
ncbi:hypothetical protein E3P99_01068 [Wallemia hederae]|uniref:Peroxisomal ATPase PEX6 n=1 Tax=Wallemia hederae TaxID=1540922 RepID=A0A4V6TMF5_9BASI|nr:hypothetical protein E3P99_01068 [Wallemia hederae]